MFVLTFKRIWKLTGMVTSSLPIVTWMQLSRPTPKFFLKTLFYNFVSKQNLLSLFLIIIMTLTFCAVLLGFILRRGSDGCEHLNSASNRTNNIFLWLIVSSCIKFLNLNVINKLSNQVSFPKTWFTVQAKRKILPKSMDEFNFKF